MAEVMIKLHRMRSPALVFALVVPLAASGQSPAEDHVLIGAGLRARPAYDGSDSQRGELIPVLRYYGRPWFARTTQGLLEGGARVELAPGLNFGAQLAYEGGRAASESSFLRSHDVPDIDPGISFGLHAEWDRKLGPVPVTLLARVRRRAQPPHRAHLELLCERGSRVPVPVKPALKCAYEYARFSERLVAARPFPVAFPLRRGNLRDSLPGARRNCLRGLVWKTEHARKTAKSYAARRANPA